MTGKEKRHKAMLRAFREIGGFEQPDILQAEVKIEPPKEKPDVLIDGFDNRKHEDNIEDYDNTMQQIDEDYGD